VAEDLPEAVVRNEDIADRIFSGDRGAVSRRDVWFEAPDRGSQRELTAVGQRERLEEDVDKPLGVGEVRRRDVDDSDRGGRSGRGDAFTVDHDRALEMNANELSGFRRFRRNGVVEHEEEG
jgi:hypothetical protein